jgi:D-amino-acid dehydrogenase
VFASLQPGLSNRAPYGHGHLGLTPAAGTAALVTGLVEVRTPEIDLEPLRAGRFD